LKKIFKLIILFSVGFNFLASVKGSANEATNTWTISVDGDYILTQTAYEPIAIISHDEISRPEDLFIDDHNNLFIADSDLGHIIILNSSKEVIRTVGAGYLQNPTGVFVTDYIFVADTEHVFQFSLTGTLINQFGRPESPLFGRTQPFRPRKIAVDARGNLYIIGEAATSGIIQLNDDGEFLGYFGANQTTLTFFGAMQNFLLGGGRIANLPMPPTNLDIAENGIVFTITHDLETAAVKQLNIAGHNMLDNDVIVSHGVDITLGNQGNFYALTANGFIMEYDSSGNLLFFFGGQDPSMQRLGILRQPTSLVVDETGNLYVADAESGFLHLFTPTEFTTHVHQALSYFEEGRYTQSEDYWLDVLRLNSSFGLAHQAIGQARFIQADHEEALARFYLANDVEGYSEAFWELRYEWLMRHTGTIIAISLAMFIIHALLKFVDKKSGVISKIKKRIRQKFDSEFLLELALMRKILKNPFDVFYEIKREKKATVKMATFLYVLMFIAIFISLYFTGFIFANNLIHDLGLILIITIFILVFGLFVIVNYLVSTINDGEGRFADIYIGTAYSMTPFIIFSVPITLLSRVLTLNERFVYTFLMQIAILWSLLLLFLMVKEIHGISIRGTFKNILMTVAGGLIMIVISFILYILLVDQVFEFIYSIFWEVLIRV
jgi:sugar lactone lactonase YvrE